MIDRHGAMTGHPDATPSLPSAEPDLAQHK
jgi:hypothetical protein